MFSFLKGKPSDEEFINAIADLDLSEVEDLIERGANVNSLGNNGATALMAASYSGNTEILSLLIRNGANINGSTRKRVGEKQQ